MDRSPEPVAGPIRARDDRLPGPVPTPTSQRDLLSESTGLDALMAALIGPEPPAATATQAVTDGPPPARVPPRTGESFGFSTMVASLDPVTGGRPDAPARSAVPFSPTSFDELMNQEPSPAQGSSPALSGAGPFEERATQGWPNPAPRSPYASPARGRKGLVIAVLAVALLSGLGLAAWSAVSGTGGDASPSANAVPDLSSAVPSPAVPNETTPAAVTVPSAPALAGADAPAPAQAAPAAMPLPPPAAATSTTPSPARNSRTVGPASPSGTPRLVPAPAQVPTPAATTPPAAALTTAPPASDPPESTAAAPEPSSAGVAPEAPTASTTPPLAPPAVITPAPASSPPASTPSPAATAPANTGTAAAASEASAAAIPPPARRDARLLSRVNPAYSATARSARISGTVDVRYTIDAKGQVTNVRATSGPAALRDASEAAVRQWRYEPALVNGQAVPTETSIRFSFGLASRQ